MRLLCEFYAVKIGGDRCAGADQEGLGGRPVRVTGVPAKKMGTQMTQQQICEECRGGGRVWRSVPRPDDPEYEEEETCRTCGGSGHVDSEPDVQL
jgi:hypothetical protein